MESSPDWMKFFCKSGELLFYYNKVTAEHRWPDNYNNFENGANICRADLVCVGTQTDDYGCIHGCGSSLVDGASIQQNNVASSTEAQPKTINASSSSSVATQNYGFEEENSLSRLHEKDNFLTELKHENFSVFENTGYGLEENAETDYLNPEFIEPDVRSNSQSELQVTIADTNLLSSMVPEDCKEEKDYSVERSDSIVGYTESSVSSMVEMSLADITGDFKEDNSLNDSSNRHVNIAAKKKQIVEKTLESTDEPPSSQQNDDQNEKSQQSMHQHQCENCGKSFVFLTNLYRHKLLHSCMKPLQCEICGMIFKGKRMLERHGFTHTGEDPCKCSTCGKEFPNRTKLIVHRYTHTKPFRCKVCEKSFSQKRSLIKHKCNRIHTCKICNQTFNNRCSFENHLRANHPALKEHQCDYCGKVCASKLNLNHHRLTHSGAKPYQCDICGKKFAQRSSVNRHKRQVAHAHEKHKNDTNGESVEQIE